MCRNRDAQAQRFQNSQAVLLKQTYKQAVTSNCAACGLYDRAGKRRTLAGNASPQDRKSLLPCLNWIFLDPFGNIYVLATPGVILNHQHGHYLGCCGV